MNEIEPLLSLAAKEHECDPASLRVELNANHPAFAGWHCLDEEIKTAWPALPLAARIVAAIYARYLHDCLATTCS